MKATIKIKCPQCTSENKFTEKPEIKKTTFRSYDIYCQCRSECHSIDRTVSLWGNEKLAPKLTDKEIQAGFKLRSTENVEYIECLLCGEKIIIKSESLDEEDE